MDCEILPTLYMLLGLQGSGKSAWAKANAGRLQAVVLSSDAIRNELEAQGQEADALNGDRVFAIFNERLKRLLKAGKNVISDATHARRAWRSDELAIARDRGAKVIAVWFDTPLALCRKRNAARPGGPWGERVVPDDLLQYLARTFEPPGEDEFDEVWKIGNATSVSNDCLRL